MPYLPKSKYSISETSGGEFIIQASKQDYTGPYIISSDGTLFAGNNINTVTANDILVPKQKPKKDNTYIIFNVKQTFSQGSVDYYNRKREDIFQKQDKFEPIISTKPSPTEKDYLNGYFFRYIAKRRNTLDIYYEIDKETYNSIRGKSGKYDHNVHQVQKMKWDLSDNSKNTNSSTIRKIQKNTQFKKLNSFFPNLREYQLSDDILRPKMSPDNINVPKPKLPLQSRKKVEEAQKGAINLIKEKARKRYNKSSGNGGSTSTPTSTPSSGGGGGY